MTPKHGMYGEKEMSESYLMSECLTALLERFTLVAGQSWVDSCEKVP